jgi:murein DD-endopeptidase MepM/ murein hydrolase activator NlpD
MYDDGRTWRGDQLKNSSYRAYGSRALAVADGVVVETTDGIPENVPDPVARAVPITPSTLGGNTIVLDIGNRLSAFYAHLQPGSLLVKKGDRVRRGQPLGLVGNSGNSSEPHLHFHLAEGNPSFDAEGIPYVFSSFDQEATADEVNRAIKDDGRSLAIDAAMLARWSARRPERRAQEMLLATTLVHFP